jgi:methylmalonyl-CoA mutase cobalamin-binding domain/chain
MPGGQPQLTESSSESPASSRAPLRFVSAASLFDGHDAAINMIRRLLQGQGAEVVHLGHNRSVADIVRAAIQEDADGIAVSSYKGGHNEYFAYMVDMLRELDCEQGRGAQAADVRAAAAGQRQRRAVIDGRADDRQAQRHVDGVAEAGVLQHRKALVVIHGQHGVAARQFARHEGGVGGNWAEGVDTRRTSADDGRADDPQFLVTEVA